MKAFLKIAAHIVGYALLIAFFMPLVSTVVVGASLLWTVTSVALSLLCIVIATLIVLLVAYAATARVSHPPVACSNLMRRLGFVGTHVVLQSFALGFTAAELLLARDFIGDITMSVDQCMLLTLGIRTVLLGYELVSGQISPAKWEEDLEKVAKG